MDWINLAQNSEEYLHLWPLSWTFRLYKHGKFLE